jgi:iron complex outermembrane recepter protein
MKMFAKRAAQAAILTAAVSIHSGAKAQTTATPPSSAAKASDAVGDIVVTAQRRSEKLSQVPISITAFTGEALAKTGVNDARTLTQVTPGLYFQSTSASAQPAIRGIGSTGSSIGDSSNVAIYVDGVYRPFQAGNYLRFADLERIEVLKGPQGTLFGRNAAGGAISITTLNPSLERASGHFALSYARFNDFEANAYISAPLDDKWAFNISGNVNESGGFRQDIYQNKKLGYIHYYSGRGKVLFQPSDATTIILSGNYSWMNDLTTFGNQPLDGNTSIRALVPTIQIPVLPNTSALNLEPINIVETYGGSLKITSDIGFATLTSLTAFTKGRQYVYTDSDLTPAAFVQAKIIFGDDTVSQDLTLSSNGSHRLSWLVGGTYYRERGFYLSRVYGGLRVPGDAPVTSGIDVNQVAIDGFAVFAEATYKLTDRLTLVGGLRFSNDKPSFTGTAYIAATGLSGPTVAPNASFSSVTPRLAIRYAITPDVNAYLSYNRGFKSGVFNAASLQATPVSPETVDAFEVGLKGAPTRTFAFDAAAYFYNYKQLQFASFGATASTIILRNAAAARIYGFEANATVRPLEGLSLRGGLAYTHGEYTEFIGAQGFRPTTNSAGVAIGGNTAFSFDASGQPLIRTPRFQANATLAYKWTLASQGIVDFNVTGSHSSRINHDISGNTQQKPFSVVNANVTYTTPDTHWRVGLFGTNIFDEKYIAGIIVSGIATAVTFAKPATYGARIEFLF